MSDLFKYDSKQEMIRMTPWFLLCVILPVYPLAASICIGLIYFVSLFFPRLLTWNGKESPLLFLPLVFYLCYLAGILFTETPGMKLQVVERKLSLIVFPVLFLFLPQFSKRNIHQIFAAFTFGAFIHSVVSFVSAASCYLDSGSRDCFFSSNFSVEIHPSYIAFYNVVIIAYWSIYFIRELKILSVQSRLLSITIIAWFTVIVVLLASKAGLICLGLLLPSVLLYFAVRYKKIKQALIAGVVVVALLASSLLFTSVPLERFQNAFASSKMSEQELFEKYRESTESTPVRQMIWVCAKELIKENPMGVGSGDANAALMQKYTEKGMTGAKEKELNAHSQYFQTTIALGYAGLLVLIAFILVPLVVAVRRRDLFMFLFFVFLAINLSVESMFETESGIVFISLFYCIFSISKIRSII